MPDPLSWLIIIFCIFATFFFSTSETALALCNKFKIQVEAEEGKKVSKLLLKIISRYERALTTVLVSHNIASVIISTLSTILFYKYLKDTGLNDYASLISSIIMTFVVYILGDVLPKTIAKAIPDTISKIVAYPIYFLMIIFSPITIFFELFVLIIEKIFKEKSDETFTSEDLEKVLEHSSEDGSLEEEQVEIIQSALEFADTSAKDILTRRKKIFALDINKLDVDSLNKYIINSSYSRIPIYEDTLDNYIGSLNVKSYIKEYLINPNINIRDILQDPYRVPNKIMLVDLLSGFKKHHTHIAMVENKDGHIIGMVTMQDVLEELVSDISEPNLIRKEVSE